MRDGLTERYSGVVARYENNSLAAAAPAWASSSNELTTTQWNGHHPGLSTRRFQCSGALYRTRQDFQPDATFVLAKPLSLTVGTSFERLRTKSGGASASANAVFTTLRYHELLEDTE